MIREHNEHEGWVCESCGSNWVRYEHLDYKDCDELNCEDPCIDRCCNEEECAGVAIYKGEEEELNANTNRADWRNS